MGARFAVIACAVCAPALAWADDPAPGAQPKLIEPVAPPSPPAEKDVSFSHKGQFEISARFATGYRTIITYNDQDYCGSIDMQSSTGLASVCSGRIPIQMDVELGYGIARRVDLFAEVRIGLEADFSTGPAAHDGPHEFHLSPGARFYFADAGHTKLFTTAQAVFDFTGYKSTRLDENLGKNRGTDIGVRNMSGIQLDLDKAYGFYVYVGETAMFARWLEVSVEAGLGVQVRYP
jgi:hypothetical protein